MRLFIGQLGCYKSTALQERREAGWRVRIWSDCKGEPARYYWVVNGQLSTVGETAGSSVAPAEREAVLNMIARWEADGLDQPSDNSQEPFQAAA